MAININDFTVERKYLDTYRFMIKEYEQVLKHILFIHMLKIFIKHGVPTGRAF